jgi:hypothetical protein
MSKKIKISKVKEKRNQTGNLKNKLISIVNQ